MALFGAINISGTGRIDKDEFADLFYHLDLMVSDEYLNKLFNAADKDGKQSYPLFVCGFRILSCGTGKEAYIEF